MADRLTLTRAFESAGMASGVAERVATEIYDAIHENVATKGDINGLRAELKAEINALRSAMNALRAELKADIDALRGEMKADSDALRAEMTVLRAEMREIEQRIVIRLGAGAVVLAGLLFTALHYWPPHGRTHRISARAPKAGGGGPPN
jgi:hypothetical protein